MKSEYGSSTTWTISSKRMKLSCFDKNSPFAHETQVTRFMSLDIMTNHSVSNKI